MELFCKLSRNLTCFSFFFLLITTINTNLQAEIKYKSVVAEGYGINPKEALGMALSEAIGKVNGKSIETENKSAKILVGKKFSRCKVYLLLVLQ